MAALRDKLDTALHGGTPLFYFASTEQPLLRAAAKYVLEALGAQGADTEVTRVDGPAPDLGAVLEAAGTVSFFGTRRLVEIRELMPTSITDKDAAELGELFAQLENAVLVVTVLYKDKRAGTTQKAKNLFAAAQRAGLATELAKPTERENLTFVERAAQKLGAGFAPGAAAALLERVGDDRVLLQNEVEKLAAMSGYATIERSLVEKYSAYNIEADVFELARFITGGQRQRAFQKLGELLQLRHEPIAIAAALAGSFVDMYRVRCGSEQGHAVGTIFKEMGYKGNDYRLKKAKENAARYKTAQLEQCVLLLYRLDTSLKSSAVPDKSALLVATVGELMLAGDRR